MIQPTSHSSGAYRTDFLANSAAQKMPAPKPSADTGDHLSSANTDALREALGHTSEVRSHVVERGRQLAADPTYPPREIIARLADLLTKSRDLSENS